MDFFVFIEPKRAKVKSALLKPVKVRKTHTQKARKSKKKVDRCPENRFESFNHFLLLFSCTRDESVNIKNDGSSSLFQVYTRCVPSS
jgi:hypothetical protein